jgi:four helix bundle protein
MEKKKIQSHKDLIAYQKAYQLSLDVYKATEDFPNRELYGIVSQMRRSAVSIPCNIAEGYDRGHRKEYVQFLYIARGSCSELETLLSLSRDLGYITTDNYEKLYNAQDEAARLLRRLIASLSIPRERS